jgi:hypothetical protein
MKQARRFAWLVMLIADAGLLAWGAMAALAPDYLLGPGSKPILAAGYEGFSDRSWQELMATSGGSCVHASAVPGVRRIRRGSWAAGGRRGCYGLSPW